MEKLFTVHITYWRGGANFYITENKTGKRAGDFFGYLRRMVGELLKDPKKAKESFDYVVEIPGEPNPIPTFVDHYELKDYHPGLGVVAHLTEKGVMREALEKNGGPRRVTTPFGPIWR